MMAYNKMNKMHRYAGRLHASIRLKYKNKFTIKKVFFNQSWIPSTTRFFWSRIDPLHGYKMVNKSSQRQLTSGTFIRENHHASHFVQDDRLQTPYQSTSQSTHSTIKSPCIFTKRPRPFIVYWPTPHYCAKPSKIIYIHICNLVEEESLYLF